MEAILVCHPAASTEWSLARWQNRVYYDVCAQHKLIWQTWCFQCCCNDLGTESMIVKIDCDREHAQSRAKWQTYQGLSSSCFRNDSHYLIRHDKKKNNHHIFLQTWDLDDQKFGLMEDLCGELQKAFICVDHLLTNSNIKFGWHKMTHSRYKDGRVECIR